MANVTTVGEYLVHRLRELGVEHLFGVPGDFVLAFMKRVEEQGMPLINTCDEQGAGFAADAYARLRGLGVVVVTYGVGGLKVANTTAQAYAERSPVVVISGAPGVGERVHHPMIHHKVREFDSQQRVFEQLTEASAVLDNPDTAMSEIDRVLGVAQRCKRPVYLELPRDMVDARVRRHHAPPPAREASDPESLGAALDEVVTLLNAAERPVLLLGEELHRFRLQEAMLRLVRHADIPVAATILGKSVIDEDEPAYLGIYQGGLGREAVRDYVEASDCVLMLGVMMTDMNLGVYTARLERPRCIHAVSGKLSVGYHVYEDVQFADFIHGLVAAPLRRRSLSELPHRPATEPYVARADATVTVGRLFQRLDEFLEEDTVVVADPGDALFGAIDLCVHSHNAFLSPAYYASLGFAVPAAVGAQLAAPHLRPLVLVGDGAFQMTGTELSTAARFGLNPIVVVLNNRGYLTERYILDGGFNDVLTWQYHKLPELLGVGRGFRVATEGELESALTTARAHTESLVLIEVMLAKMDASPTLRRLAAGLAERAAAKP